MIIVGAYKSWIMNIQFCVKLGKIANETLQQVYGDKNPSCSTVF